MVFDKEKLLDVYDETKDNPKDPIRTARGRLGPASEFQRLADAGPGDDGGPRRSGGRSRQARA